MPKTIDVAWASGLFDGEGTAGVAPRGKRYPHLAYLRLRVAQSHDTEVLERWRDAFDLGVAINGPYTEKERYEISVCGGTAERVADEMMPYLSTPKREQIARARAKCAEIRGIN